MDGMRAEVRERLLSLIDEKYRDFHSGLLPGTEGILGVRLPELRKLAREIAKGDFRAYLAEVRDLTPETPGVSYEESMLEGLVIGYGKMPFSEALSYLDIFVPKIRNWAVCDCCCSTYKFMEKYPEESWEYIQKYARSDAAFEIRFALVCMLDYFVKEEYLDQVFDHVNRICGGGGACDSVANLSGECVQAPIPADKLYCKKLSASYNAPESCDSVANLSGECVQAPIPADKLYYVQMAAAWLLSVCYVKFPERTERFLEKNDLDDFTQNKAIQKIRESYRVSKEDKERLNRLKRGKK